ncbi:MAG: GNAT family N-acetyltransferase [Candidatus Methylomirabilales bacterium]
MITEGTIRLRPLEEADLERTLRWVNDPAVAQGVNRVLPVTRLEHAEWYRRLVTDRTQVAFAIERTEDPAHIGNCGLRGLDPRVRQGELWIYLGEQAEWGKGYGRDATRALLRYGFESLNLHRVVLTVVADNHRAIRLYEALGFVREGVLRDGAYLEGAYRDLMVMAMLRAEYDGRAGRRDR